MKSTIYCLIFIMCAAYSSMNAMHGPSYLYYEKALQLKIEQDKYILERNWESRMLNEYVSNDILDMFNRGCAEPKLQFHQELCKRGHLPLIKKLLDHLNYSDMRPIYESGLQISREHEQHACAEFFAKKLTN